MIKLSQIRTACALKTEYVAVLNKKSSKPLTPGNKESNARRIHRHILKGSTMVHNSEAKIFDNKNQIIRAPVTRTISKVAVTMIGRLLLSRACPLKGPSLPHDLWLPLSTAHRNVRDDEAGGSSSKSALAPEPCHGTVLAPGS